MKFGLYFWVCLTAFFFASCKKEVIEDSKPRLVKSYENNKHFVAGDCLKTDFFYDNQSRLISRISCETEFTYSYPESKKIIHQKFVNGILEYTINYFLNDKFLIQSYQRIQGTDTTWWGFEFDADGFRKKRWLIGNNERYTLYTRTGNNLTKEQFFEPVDTDEKTYSFIYYEGKKNTFSEENTGTLFLGKYSNELVKTMQLLLPDGTGSLIDYSYDLSEDGYILNKYSRVLYENGVLDSFKTTFTYY